MRNSARCIFVLLTGHAVATAGDLATVYSQPPISISSATNDTIAIASTRSDDPYEPRAKTFDNFVLNEAIDLVGISWRGAFNNEFNPNSTFRGDLDFDIWFYESDTDDKPNLDAAVFFASLEGGKAGINDSPTFTSEIVPDSRQKDGGFVIDYHTEWTPKTFPAGEYWVSIVANQTLPSPHPDDNPSDPNRHLDPTWSWVQAQTGDAQIYNFDAAFDPVEPGIRLADAQCGEPCDVTFTLFTYPSNFTLGDYNDDGIISAHDIDVLSASVIAQSVDWRFDLNQDGQVDPKDHTFWVQEIAGSLAGDTNLDGQVDFTDFLSLSRNFGRQGGWELGDFNGDNLIQFSDFMLLARNFGQQSQSLIASVPEPSSIAIVTVTALSGLWVVRRKRKIVDVTVIPISV